MIFSAVSRFFLTCKAKTRAKIYERRNRFEVFRNLRDPPDDKFQEKSEVALLVNFCNYFYFLWCGRFAAIICSLAFICLLSR